MTDALPQRGQVSLVPQTNLITLHQPHIWGQVKGHKLETCTYQKLHTKVFKDRAKLMKTHDTIPCTHLTPQPKQRQEETKNKNKTMHAYHQKMQGWGRLRARTEGRGGVGWELHLYHRTTGRKESLENYHLNPS